MIIFKFLSRFIISTSLLLILNNNAHAKFGPYGSFTSFIKLKTVIARYKQSPDTLRRNLSILFLGGKNIDKLSSLFSKNSNKQQLVQITAIDIFDFIRILANRNHNIPPAKFFSYVVEKLNLFMLQTDLLEKYNYPLLKALSLGFKSTQMTRANDTVLAIMIRKSMQFLQEKNLSSAYLEDSRNYSPYNYFGFDENSPALSMYTHLKNTFFSQNSYTSYLEGSEPFDESMFTHFDNFVDPDFHEIQYLIYPYLKNDRIDSSSIEAIAKQASQLLLTTKILSRKYYTTKYSRFLSDYLFKYYYKLRPKQAVKFLKVFLQEMSILNISPLFSSFIKKEIIDPTFSLAEYYALYTSTFTPVFNGPKN
jgi:hypothetical protein